MSIYRGAGGAGDAVNDASSEAVLVQQLATEAQDSADAAATSETNAANSATAAASSASAASTSASNAATSATNASNSASTATTQATNAANSATAAQTAETAAELAETNAETAQAAAASSASAASSSASAASTSATNASNSATAAASSATTASAASAAALTALDSFDDRYLGSKSTAPTLDNDGNALLAGALYFNTVSNSMKVYTGTIWVDAYADGNTFLAKASNLSDLTNTATARTNLGVAIGTNVQAYDAQLADIAGLTPSDNNFIVGNGTNFVTESNSTARTSLGLGSIATQDSSNVTVTGGSINGTTVGATTASTGAFTTLGATGVATFSAGTVSAPAITTTGDTNTGIFFPAADTIAFTEGGVESMRINSSGFVGIGTDSPSLRLNVNSGAAGGIASFQSTATVADVYLVDSGTTSGQVRLRSTSNTLAFLTDTTERMRISSTGDVGIGTNSPTSRLHVLTSSPLISIFASSDATNSYVAFRYNTSATFGYIGNGSGLAGGSSTDLTVRSEANLVFASSGANERMRINSAGDVTIGTTLTGLGRLAIAGFGSGNIAPDIQILRSSSGTSIQSGPNLSFSDGTTNNSTTLQVTQGRFGIWNYGGGAWLERMSVTGAGNVGIGVTPSANGNFLPSLQIRNTVLNSGVAGDRTILAYNYDRTGGADTYISTGFASYYRQINSTHAWFTAPSGTAGNAITFTQAMTLDASGNLQLGTTTAVTSNGTNLNIYGASASNLSLQNATSGTGNNNGFQLIQDGVITYLQNRENGAMTFATNNTERMRIHASGGVSIGNTTDSGAGVLNVNNSILSPFAKLTANGTGSSNAGLLLDYSGVVQWQIYPETTTGALTIVSAGSTRVKIDTSGNVLVGITSARANAGDVQVSKGISFPATQSAQSDANTLDDYEEGTWTVSFYDASTAGNVSSTTTTGYYTKIGNIVTISCAQLINISTAGLTAGNTLYITLPFPVGSSANAVGNIALGNLDVSGTCTLVFDARASATRASILQVIDAAGFADTPVSAVTSGVSDLVGFSLTYRV